MYIRLSFLYQCADKMTKHLSRCLHKPLFLSTESTANEPATYLIFKLCSSKKKPEMNRISIGKRLLGINPIYRKNEGPPRSFPQYNVR